MTSTDHDKNAESRGRLLALVDQARSERSSRNARAAMCGLLAHLAFWDRVTLLRWERAAEAGEPIPVRFDSSMTDLINDAAFPQWQLMAFEDAASDALASAEQIDRFIEGLNPTVIQDAISAGREQLVDRSVHRKEHIVQLVRTLEMFG